MGCAMKFFYAPTFLALALCLLSGCAGTLNVTYDSDPPGAVLYQGQQRVGYTPYTLRYQVSDEEKTRGYKVLAGTSARWMSGAVAEVSSLEVDLKRYGYSPRYTFRRPADVPGREADERFSLELERTRAIHRQATAQEEQAAAQRRQAVAQEEQAAAQRRQAAAQEDRARAERYRMPSPTNCTSSVWGNTVNTSCY
jgi:hypothetical protein